MRIDVSFDFRTDAAGKDPDISSPTLRRYHRLLWSKPLPRARAFDLTDTKRGAYLHHDSDLGTFSLASDSVMQTFTRWTTMKHITSQFPEEENEAFQSVGYTIGGMMIFPGNKVDGKMTINGMRGFNPRIADRFDLTVECIRLHYMGRSSPLGDTLARYDGFFALFDDFQGYVDFFLLQDLVSADYSNVKFFMPFDDFQSRPTPKDHDSYAEYRRLSIAFIASRNHRIDLAAASLS